MNAAVSGMRVFFIQKHWFAAARNKQDAAAFRKPWHRAGIWACSGVWATWASMRCMPAPRLTRCNCICGFARQSCPRPETTTTKVNPRRRHNVMGKLQGRSRGTHDGQLRRAKKKYQQRAFLLRSADFFLAFLAWPSWPSFQQRPGLPLAARGGAAGAAAAGFAWAAAGAAACANAPTAKIRQPGRQAACSCEKSSKCWKVCRAVSLR